MTATLTGGYERLSISPLFLHTPFIFNYLFIWLFIHSCIYLLVYLFVVFPTDPNKSATTMENKVLSPLHYACWFNASEAVDTLLDNKANVESCAAFGQKPLHYAVTRASVELVKVRIIAYYSSLY